MKAIKTTTTITKATRTIKPKSTVILSEAMSASQAFKVSFLHTCFYTTSSTFSYSASTFFPFKMLLIFITYISPLPEASGRSLLPPHRSLCLSVKPFSPALCVCALSLDDKLFQDVPSSVFVQLLPEMFFL